VGFLREGTIYLIPKVELDTGFGQQSLSRADVMGVTLPKKDSGTDLSAPGTP